jgi:hypothetical protein
VRTWELVWDGPVPPNMNGSDSPFRRRKARRLWRANAQIMANLADLPRREIVRYRISGTILRRNLGVADQDGDHSRMKSVIDGLVADLYLPDDTRRYAVWGDVDEAHGKPGFVLRIEELPSDDETTALAHRRYARNDDTDPLALVRRVHRRATPPATPRRQALPGGAESRRRARPRRQYGADPGR